MRIVSTLNKRFISVDGSFITFEPPMKSDAGSYWCRSKTNHSNTAEGKLMYKGNVYHASIEMLLRVCLFRASTIVTFTVVYFQHCFQHLYT